MDMATREKLLTLIPCSYEQWDGDQPVLIFHNRDGEVWKNQAGGVACSHPEVKGHGFLLPYFSGQCMCGYHGNYDDMQKQLDRAGLPVLITGGEEAALDVTVTLGMFKHDATIFYNNCD